MGSIKQRIQFLLMITFYAAGCSNAPLGFEAKDKSTGAVDEESAYSGDVKKKPGMVDKSKTAKTPTVPIRNPSQTKDPVIAPEETPVEIAKCMLPTQGTEVFE